MSLQHTAEEDAAVIAPGRPGPRSTSHTGGTAQTFHDCVNIRTDVLNIAILLDGHSFILYPLNR